MGDGKSPLERGTGCVSPALDGRSVLLMTGGVGEAIYIFKPTMRKRLRVWLVKSGSFETFGLRKQFFSPSAQSIQM
jgi:hypothetical protein